MRMGSSESERLFTAQRQKTEAEQSHVLVMQQSTRPSYVESSTATTKQPCVTECATDNQRRDGRQTAALAPFSTEEQTQRQQMTSMRTVF